jgi:hypothetical protein
MYDHAVLVYVKLVWERPGTLPTSNNPMAHEARQLNRMQFIKHLFERDSWRNHAATQLLGQERECERSCVSLVGSRT